jgi:predicted GNAT family N-acyltransferase
MPGTGSIVLTRVPVDRILALRHRVLRPGRPAETARFDGDDAPTTRHYGALVADTSAPVAGADAPVAETCVLESDPLPVPGTAVSCLTLLASTWNGNDAWQLRGMATDERHRRTGLGSRLLAHALADARGDGPDLPAWCNARIAARGFYERQGWVVVSEPFEIAGIGPHVRMLRAT